MRGNVGWALGAIAAVVVMAVTSNPIAAIIVALVGYYVIGDR